MKGYNNTLVKAMFLLIGVLMVIMVVGRINTQEQPSTENGIRIINSYDFGMELCVNGEKHYIGLLDDVFVAVRVTEDGSGEPFKCSMEEAP